MRLPKPIQTANEPKNKTAYKKKERIAKNVKSTAAKSRTRVVMAYTN